MLNESAMRGSTDRRGGTILEVVALVVILFAVMQWAVGAVRGETVSPVERSVQTELA